ncbi:putative diguanylate cyclase (GGDEF domain) [Vibrio ichthyoenteri ATCC 700023]|uniref:diguanylate cyclase n=1 Tax=Vibrio ichthyoenteri ATCC 700023 TaxID=870968 RepID=F9RZ67_9VIBR|nr:GGDEF domain-containing protein [Vibrio ichthyoenteri]EGU45950.1 putative diguanylate cyclase (GGDEF domain) [Vibrio ichthyoenteri ATCC 700023]
MITVIKRLSINQMLFMSHLCLVLLVIAGLSFTRYESEWQRQVDYSAALANQALQSQVHFFSTSVAGVNYANLTMASVVERLASIDDLEFIEVKGVSDYSSQEVYVRYIPTYGKVWRANVTDQDLQLSYERVTRLKAQLKTVETHNTIEVRKLNYLLVKAQAERDSLTNSNKLALNEEIRWLRPLSNDERFYLDEQSYLLNIEIPLRNNNGGYIWAVFDASKLAAIKKNIIREIGFEAIAALLLVICIAYWVTHRIVSPLKNLAISMNSGARYKTMKDLDELNREDEIGQLARAYKGRLMKIDQQLDSLRAKSDADLLTGLGSRYKYSRTALPYIQQNVLRGKYVGLMICDIDNFKAYNDIYGHMAGDDALASVAGQLQSKLTNVDMAFRYGGEEFVILCARHDREELERSSELLRRAIEQLAIEHIGNADYGRVTVSIGGALAQRNSLHRCDAGFEELVESLFSTADKTLYECKRTGRNRVAWASVFTTQLAVYKNESSLVGS